jgi:4-alpha-glucanotransferase
MLIEFQIAYKTWYGQRLMLVGTLPQLGSGSDEKGVAMEYSPEKGGIWRYRLETEEEVSFRYRYLICNDQDGSAVREWGMDRTYVPGSDLRGWVILSDCWRRLSDPAAVFYSSAFTQAIFRPAERVVAAEVPRVGRKKSVVVRFSPSASRVMPGQQLAVCGSSALLGSWDGSRALKAGNADFPVWSCEVSLPVADFPLSYKYVLSHHDQDNCTWEEGPNRVISLPQGEIPQIIEIRDEQFAFPGPPWKGAGVAIPLFSLRRQKGFGVGEFTDLMILADWAASVGLRMIQILPVNDTVATHTWHDSYPYAAISVFALHPIYVNLLKIGKLQSAITQRIIDAQGEYLNGLGCIDYEAVMALKSRFFKLIYDQQKEAFLGDQEFKAFFAANAHWLKPYAAFSYLRDLFNTPDFTHWDGFADFTPGLLRELTDPAAPHYDDIAIHYFIQYQAHVQLLEAARYARTRGVVLKGDIPIGIYRNSVDAWTNPRLFHMDGQAGAPADDFSVTGQNWRFPTYNWEAMASDNYQWWQQRLRQMSAYFDAFRIDHILGFFRIWEIPAHQVQGLMGYFNPSIPYSREEILSRGIRFDEKRYCQPYIRDYFLQELFGELTAEVKRRYLDEYAPGCYALRPAYDTQQKIEASLASSPDDDADRKSYLNRLKQGLYTLVAEILFIEAPGSGGKAWYPRNGFHATHAFRDLDPGMQQLLDALYIDYFYRRNEAFWRDKAMQKLPVIRSATQMLLCGEDLGMVPACVPEVMNELGILSLEVQRMPKDPHLEFGRPDHYPYLSVATPSSHDTSTIRGWWEENPARTRKFYNEVLGLPGEAPATCTPEMVTAVIAQHLWSPAMWTVFPIQDLLGMEERLRHPDAAAERINQPGNPDHYWRYRLHLSLEELAKETAFNQMLRQMITTTGRYPNT